MSRELFVAKKFNADHETVIERANVIIAEYSAQGFTLTLRQLYYQFVARGFLANRVQEYKRLGSIISDARLAGRVDWAAIEDRLRVVNKQSFFSNPSHAIASVAEWYRENKWKGQDRRVEVWIEKDALGGVIEPVCERWQMSSLACRGYLSQSAQYAAGKRMARYVREGLRPIILHLGDHDPSGVDMTRDNSDRLDMFARMGVEIVRLALNMDQIEQYNPPPNPAKETDSRHSGYSAKYGDESWELDALSPTVIDELIDSYVRENIIDESEWATAASQESDNRDLLRKLAEQWDDVAARLDEEE